MPAYPDVAVSSAQMLNQPYKGVKLRIRHSAGDRVIVTLHNDADGACVMTAGMSANGVLRPSAPDCTVFVHLKVVSDARPAVAEMPVMHRLHRHIRRLVM